MEIREIRESDYDGAIEISNLAMKELYNVEPTMDFNFKIKNIFVTPGNVAKIVMKDKMIVGIFVMTEERFIHNDKKKMNVNFFYMLPEYRTEDAMNQVYEYVANFAVCNGSESVGFDTSLPFFSNHMIDNFELKKTAVSFEKVL